MNYLDEDDSERQQREQQKMLSFQTQIDDLKWLMSDSRGRRYIRRLLESSGVFRSSFSPDVSIYFLEGERNAGLKILAELNLHTPSEYILMLQEHLVND